MSAVAIIKQNMSYDLFPRRLRTFREFAEQEIILPNGPRAGLPFACDYMPWSGLLLNEFDAHRYRRFFGSGPVQSGKTLMFFITPTMYHLFEIRENVIVGVPKMDLAQGIYDERLLPVIQRSRYRDLLPTRGSGSRGGKFVSVQFQNGAILRFMGAGGGDEQRSSHTARVVILTEIDKMDVPGAVSREADPVTQLEARTRAYGNRARVYAECTMSTREGRVFQEVVKFGTHTRVYLPCPHCGEYVVPDRDHFVGWQQADDVMVAREKAAYVCPECGVPWTETDRHQACRTPVLAAKDQTVSRDGQSVGETLRTNTFGFVWNAMHSELTTMADIAEAEYRAEQSDNPNDRKAVMQFVWAEPYEEELVNLSGITRDMVLKKIGPHPRGVAPDGTTKLTVFVDLGLYRCWWSTWAWRASSEGYLIDYGAIEVPQDREANKLAILATLRSFRDSVLTPGWKCGNRAIVHDLCLVDSGYAKDIAYKFVKESGQRRYHASKGLGTARNQENWREIKPGKDRLVGPEWFVTLQPEGVHLVNLHSDHWKREVHQGFAAPPGTPGSLHLYHAEPRDHIQYARQITAERQEEEFIPGRGNRVFWNQITKDNHWLDCAYGCRAAADMLGVRLIPTQKTIPKKVVKHVPIVGQSKIRTHY
jgi:phage terminase large subunit GpA-like protein